VIISPGVSPADCAPAAVTPSTKAIAAVVERPILRIDSPALVFTASRAVCRTTGEGRDPFRRQSAYEARRRAALSSVGARMSKSRNAARELAMSAIEKPLGLAGSQPRSKRTPILHAFGLP